VRRKATHLLGPTDADVAVVRNEPRVRTRARLHGQGELSIADMYYTSTMVSGDLIRESRLRAGLTQAELGARIGKPQSVIARWERGDVDPSLETLRRVIRGCGLDLHFHLSRLDDSNETIIDHHLKMTPAERFVDLLARVDFHDRVQRERAVGNA
jgi:transcriptional regulator with XRE-family HTH domain